MNKFLYSIMNLPEVKDEGIDKDTNERKLPLYLKWWLYNRSKQVLSEILTGSNLTLPNSAKNRRFKKFIINGETEQAQYEGYNLANLDRESFEGYGLNIINNNDGTWTINGTINQSLDVILTKNFSMDTSIYNFKNSNYLLKTEIISGNYTVENNASISTKCFGKVDGVNNFNMMTNNWNRNTNIFSEIYDWNDSSIRSLTRIELYLYILNDNSSITFNNCKIRILLANTNNAELNYEPYVRRNT